MLGAVGRIALVVQLACSASARGQVSSDAYLPPRLPAEALPPPPALHRHYEGLRLFAQARLHEQRDRLVEAVRLYEASLKIEAAPATYRALVPLCLALDRKAQALEYSAKASAAEPHDFELRFRHAKLLAEQGRLKEAAEQATLAVGTPGADANADAFVNMCVSAAALREQLEEFDEVRKLLRQAVAVLDNPSRFAGFDPESLQRVHAESSRLHERLGKLAIRDGLHEEAIAHLRTALHKDPQRATQVQFILAELYLAQGEKTKAVEQLERYIASQPSGTDAYEMLIKLLTDLGREKEIIPALEGAASRDSFNQALKRLLAREYVCRGEADKGEKIYRGLLEDRPDEQAYRGLAKLYQEQGRWRDLLARFDECLGGGDRPASSQVQFLVLAQDKALLKGLVTEARNVPRSGRTLAPRTRRALTALCRQAKLFDDAEHFCRLCLADDGAEEEATIELCRILSEARKHEALANLCREALKKPLQTPKLVFQIELARSLALLGQAAEAEAVCRDMLSQAKAESDDHFRASVALAHVLYRTGQLDRASAELTRLEPKAEEPQRRRQVRYLLSSVHHARGDLAKAEEYLQKILDDDPEDAAACNDLGYLWADQNKKLEEAERLIRKAIALDRADRRNRRGPLEIAPEEADNAAYVDSLGWVLYRQGKLEEARRELERAARLDDHGDPVIHDHLGDVYRDLHQLRAARAAWEKALELYRQSKRVGRDDRRQAVEAKLRQLEGPP